MRIQFRNHFSYISVALLLFLSSFLHAQEHISWDVLADVQWTDKYDEKSGVNLLQGEFGKSLLKYRDQEIFISGYVMPLDGLGLNYALSRTSFASCFFCGQAGPETVMELKVKPRSIAPHRQKEVKITFKGTLRLNEFNSTGLNYILENAKEVGT